MRADFFVVFVFVSFANGLHLPKYIKACPFNDPDFRKCAVQHGNDAISHLFHGDRAYGIPSFVPFKISFVSMSTSGFEMNLTEATFSGIENGKVVDYMLDPVNKKYYSSLSSPVITFEFNYSVGGKIASLPIEGNGLGWMKIYDGNYTYAFDWDVDTRDGKHYMVIGEDNVVIDAVNFKCHLDNLFNGNEQLGNHLNQFLNENWREILTEFNPVITKVFGAISKEILGKIYLKIPLEEIFPGIEV